MLYMPHENGQNLIAFAIGCLPIVSCILFLVLALLGPAIGNVYSNIVDAL